MNQLIIWQVKTSGTSMKFDSIHKNSVPCHFKTLQNKIDFRKLISIHKYTFVKRNVKRYWFTAEIHHCQKSRLLFVLLHLMRMNDASSSSWVLRVVSSSAISKILSRWLAPIFPVSTNQTVCCCLAHYMLVYAIKEPRSPEPLSDLNKGFNI